MSTKVRAIEVNGDWTFGKGANNYLQNLSAVSQNIKTRLQSFLGDCFFDINAGIDWFNLLGAKDQTELNLRIQAVILNTPNVLSLVSLTTSLSADRVFVATYTVVTSFGDTTGAVTAP